MGQELSHISASEQLEADLGIDGPFFTPFAGDAGQSMQRVVCLIQQDWLSKQINAEYVSPQSSASAKQLSSEEKADLLQPSFQHELNGWQRVSVVIMKKPLKKLRINKGVTHCGENYSLFEFLQQAATKDRNDDEELMNARFGSRETPKTTNFECLCEEKLKKLIEQSSGMTIKKIASDSSPHPIINKPQNEEIHSFSHEYTLSPHQFHFVPLLLACQNEDFMYFLEATPSYTLHDVLAFSPAVVSHSAAKYMFLFYQILRIFSAVESYGLSLSSSINFKDFYVTNSMWISISRFTVDDTDVHFSKRSEQTTVVDSWSLETPKLLTHPFLCEKKLQDYTIEWVNCELTTFDYLMILNTLAGRRMKDPAQYPIFPWVVDFTKANGGYRDFTKSKYRLCKSDAQLDITFNQPASSTKDATGPVPHHISHDPLTAITFYVYVSRRISKETLCRHVRSRWVPDEYPSSMERLYAWTPEECIPEFYSDPAIFRSIHPDLHDLKIPSWTESPEDFVKYHRSVLESPFVSQRLNDWIDLVFGYKLSGMASIDSKNVYLSLVDGHNHLTNCGVLQLFSRPHPMRRIQDLNEEVVFPKSCNYIEEDDNTSAFVHSEIDDPSANDIACVNGTVVEEGVYTRKPIAIRRDLWSIDSAIDEASQIEETYKAGDAEAGARHRAPITLLPSGLRMRIDTLLDVAGSESKVPIADDLMINSDGCSDFIADLEAIEKELKFQCNIAPADSYGVNRYEFGSIYNSKQKENKKKKTSESSLDFANNRSTFTLVNILIELALHEYVRLRTKKLSVEERLNENTLLMRAHLHRFPSWLLAILESWLKSFHRSLPDETDEDVIVNSFFRHPGLLLCQHNNPFPYPKYFPSLHGLLATLFDCAGLIHDSSVPMGKDNLITVFSGNPLPSINSISRAAHLLPHLIEELDKEGINLLFSFLLPLFSDPATKLYAFLQFFHPLGIVMGFHSSLRYFFVELQKLYGEANEFGPVDSKLMDQNFISKIITVFGLNCFLECFVQYVIDGLIEISDSEYSKEKNGSDNFEAESGDFQSEKSSKIYLENTSERMNEMAEGEKSFKMEVRIPNTDSIPNRKPADSFIDDEDNIDVLDPKPLGTNRLGESGVFTRLESIVEDAKFIRINDYGDSDQDAPQDRNSTGQGVLESLHDLYSVSEDDSGSVFEEENDSEKPRFFKVLDKSEVIYNGSESASVYPDSTAIVNHGKTHPLEEENAEANCTQSERGNSEVSTVISSPTSHLSSSLVSSDNFKKGRRSTLSESIQSNLVTQSAEENHGSNFNPNEVNNASPLDLNYQGNNADDDVGAAIEEFSIESMCSEDDSRSFLIRRSSVKVRGHSGSSPFMVLHSDADVSDEENAAQKTSEGNPVDEYANLQVDRIPGGGELDSIAKVGISDETVATDLSAEELALNSLKWIMPWLGPVLTSKYIMNFLLKRIPKVWLNVKNMELNTTELISAFKNKSKFLMDCIMEVVGTYGIAVVYYHFIPFSNRAVSAALKANTVSIYVEGQLFSSIHILSRALISLSSDILANEMEILSQDIFEPSLRLLSSSKSFSSGSKVRSVLLYSLVDLLAILSKKLGQLDARDAMTPLLQRFFSCFDCVYRLERKHGSCSAVLRKHSFFVSNGQNGDYVGSFEDSAALDEDTTLNDSTRDTSSNIGPAPSGACETEEQDKVSLSIATINDVVQGQVEERGVSDGSLVVMSNNEGVVNSRPTSKVHTDSKGEDLAKDPKLDYDGSDKKQMNEKAVLEMNQYKDLCDSFTPHLAHYSYVLFCRVLGDHFVSSIIYNEALIWQLCSNFDEGLTLTSKTDAIIDDKANFGKKQELITRKEEDEDKVKDAFPDSAKKFTRKMTFSEHDDDTPTFKSTWQHIEGDWLHMWKERLDTRISDRALSFRGRRLQTYAGHSSAVRDIYIPDNEHYFLSASRDKTVKLWLLKNHGNGTAQIGCAKTYDKHNKSVFAIQSIESKRFAVSCDGTVHVWDPIKSATVGQVDLGKSHSIVSIQTLPVPSTTIAMASTEGTIRLYDVRQKSVCNEWKLVSNSAAGNVKCLCTNDNGTWIAAGFSNGFISVLDLRTGILRGQWRAHEAEILQIEAYNDHNFLSTSNDLRIKMWNEDGSLALRIKSPPEPVHCLTLCKDQCIWATTNGNKIGITHHISNWANYDCKKLPQELFKGTISKLKVLPVNQLYLVGSENGNVVMFD